MSTRAKVLGLKTLMGDGGMVSSAAPRERFLHMAETKLGGKYHALAAALHSWVMAQPADRTELITPQEIARELSCDPVVALALVSLMTKTGILSTVLLVREPREGRVLGVYNNVAQIPPVVSDGNGGLLVPSPEMLDTGWLPKNDLVEQVAGLLNIPVD